MVYKTVSSDIIISKIYRDFKPNNSGWVQDALEWIGEGLEIIGAFTGMERKPFCVKIVDYKGKLPCGLEQIDGISYNNFRLPHSNSTNDIRNRCTDIPLHTTEFCSFNPNYIQTSFEKGEVIIYAQVLPTDCNGLPMIPDNTLCKIALSWYCMTMMLSRGFKHQTFSYKDALAMWNLYYPQAQNDMNYPDIERYEHFTKTWTSLVINLNKQSEFFNDFIGLPNKVIETGTITAP